MSTWTTVIIASAMNFETEQPDLKIEGPSIMGHVVVQLGDKRITVSLEDLRTAVQRLS